MKNNFKFKIFSERLEILIKEYSESFIGFMDLKPALFLVPYFGGGLGKKYRTCGLFGMFSESSRIADIPRLFSQMEGTDLENEFDVARFFLQWIFYLNIPKRFREISRLIARNGAFFDMAEKAFVSGSIAKAAEISGITEEAYRKNAEDCADSILSKFVSGGYDSLVLLLSAFRGGAKEISVDDIAVFSDIKTAGIFAFGIDLAGFRSPYYCFDEHNMLFRILFDPSKDLNGGKPSSISSSVKIIKKLKPVIKPEHTKNVTGRPAYSDVAIAEVEKVLREAGAGMELNGILEKVSVSKNRARAALDSRFAFFAGGLYWHKDSVDGFESFASSVEDSLDSLFEKNGGVASEADLFKEIKSRIPEFFIANPQLDSSSDVYSVARKLFEKDLFHNRQFIFRGKFVWREEPSYQKNIMGVCMQYVRSWGGFSTKADILEWLDMNGFAKGYFSSFIPFQNIILQYDKGCFVLSEKLSIDDSFINAMKVSLERLMQGKDYILMSKIGKDFYESLPVLGSGLKWSCFILGDIISGWDLGFQAVRSSENNCIAMPKCAIVRNGSRFIDFSCIIYNEMKQAGDLPAEMDIGEFRDYLIARGMIANEANKTNVCRTIERNPNFSVSSKIIRISE